MGSSISSKLINIYIYIANMENGPFGDDLPVRIVIFNSYVS